MLLELTVIVLLAEQRSSFPAVFMLTEKLVFSQNASMVVLRSAGSIPELLMYSRVSRTVKPKFSPWTTCEIAMGTVRHDSIIALCTERLFRDPKVNEEQGRGGAGFLRLWSVNLRHDMRDFLNFYQYWTNIALYYIHVSIHERYRAGLGNSKTLSTCSHRYYEI